MKYRVLLFLFCLGVVSCTYIGEPLIDGLKNKVSETPDYLLIESSKQTATTCFVFYPGALVNVHCYLKWVDNLVSTQPDIKVMIVKMPANLAVLAPEKALRLMDEIKGVVHWWIGGHSLGGAMAGSPIIEYPNKFDALIYMAAYPTNDKLKNWDKTVVSISASNDGLATPQDIEASKQNLPPAFIMQSPTNFVLPITATSFFYTIQGGNHAQFGSYGKQENDNEPTISEALQHQKIVDVLVSLHQQLY